ncbi:MAG: dTDP-4-dehydrorhamnose 3,5-epimerase [Ignavibacteriaceae bacterium]|jgi:dTDP-4-dehydrorhamnose 3,5-epimerase
MKIEKTSIEEVKILYPNVYNDERGYFFESFQAEKYKEILGEVSFFQDNISFSEKGTVRGLHYQVGEFAQGKLCQVPHGKVLDVAVDIRFGYSSFGKYVAIELSEENHAQLWIPPGFAHGFAVLSDTALFSYKCSSPYHKPSERSIRYNDPDLNISWNVNSPIVSLKDMQGKLFREIERDFIY